MTYQDKRHHTLSRKPTSFCNPWRNGRREYVHYAFVRLRKGVLSPNGPFEYCLLVVMFLRVYALSRQNKRLGIFLLSLFIVSLVCGFSLSLSRILSRLPILLCGGQF